MPETVLVTGGCGFIGSHLVDRLVVDGYRVRVIDNLTEQVHRGSEPDYLNGDVEYRFEDINDRGALRSAMSGVDIIFHLAAAVGVGQSMYEPYEYVRTNTLATAGLLQEIINGSKRPRKLIVASSMSVYGEGAYECPFCGLGGGQILGERNPQHLQNGEWNFLCPTCNHKLQPISTAETKPVEPASVYAQTKLDQETLCLTVGRAYKVPTVALRFFNAYGPRQALSNPYTGVAAIFSSRLRNDQQPVVYEDGEQQRDFVHVSDLVSACLLVLAESGADHRIFNVGSGEPISIGELGRTLIAIHGSDVELSLSGRYRVGDIRHCFADIAAIRALGFEPSIPLETGLRELVAWSDSVQAEDRFDQAQSELREHGIG